MKYLFVILMLFLLVSCSNNVEKVMKGAWTIDYVEYKGQLCFLCLDVNVITFQKNNIVLFPSNSCPELLGVGVMIENGTWSVQAKHKEPIVLKMTSVTSAFEGDFQLYFYKDEENKLFKVRVLSEGLDMVMSKLMFHYQSNIKLMNELVSMNGNSIEADEKFFKFK